MQQPHARPRPRRHAHAAVLTAALTLAALTLAACGSDQPTATPAQAPAAEAAPPVPAAVAELPRGAAPADNGLGLCPLLTPELVAAALPGALDFTLVAAENASADQCAGTFRRGGATFQVIVVRQPGAMTPEQFAGYVSQRRQLAEQGPDFEAPIPLPDVGEGAHAIPGEGGYAGLVRDGALFAVSVSGEDGLSDGEASAALLRALAAAR